MTTDRRAFTVILEKEKGGGFSAYCPALPGCVSQGDDHVEAMRNIKEAISLVLNVLDVETAGRRIPLRKDQSPKSPPPYPETPALIAEEMRIILEYREKDGLPYDGVYLERVALTVGAHV